LLAIEEAWLNVYHGISQQYFILAISLLVYNTHWEKMLSQVTRHQMTGTILYIIVSYTYVSVTIIQGVGTVTRIVLQRET